MILSALLSYIDIDIDIDTTDSLIMIIIIIVIVYRMCRRYRTSHPSRHRAGDCVFLRCTFDLLLDNTRLWSPTTSFCGNFGEPSAELPLLFTCVVGGHRAGCMRVCGFSSAFRSINSYVLNFRLLTLTLLTTYQYRCHPFFDAPNIPLNLNLLHEQLLMLMQMKDEG